MFNTVQIMEKYNNISKQCKQAIYAHINPVETIIISLDRLKIFYKYVNSMHIGVAPLKNAFGNVVSNDSSKSEILNIYFSSVFVNNNGVIPDNHTLPNVTNSIGQILNFFLLI